MMIHGWCEDCHRIRRVFVRIPPLRGVAIGVCHECTDKRDAKRKRAQWSDSNWPGRDQ